MDCGNHQKKLRLLSTTFYNYDDAKTISIIRNDSRVITEKWSAKSNDDENLSGFSSEFMSI